MGQIAWSDTRAALRADLSAMCEGQYVRPFTIILRLLLHARWRAIVAFRVAQWLIGHRLGKPFALLLTDRILAASGAELQPTSQVGPGLVLKHTTGLVLGGRVVAGERLTLHQNVTLGDRHPHGGHPRLGDDVTIGVGAVVLGPIEIGSRVTIAAGAVVLQDVPSDSLVAGVPARVIRRTSPLGDSVEAHDSPVQS